MGKAFRWIGEGILKDVIDGRVVVYMGRRTDATGHVVEGEIVRNHTIDAAKLEDWVKAGRAEHINVVENVLDKVTAKPSAEAEREAGIHQQTADHTDASLRLQALADLRRVTAASVFDDDDRKLAEMEFEEVSTAGLRDFIDSAARERDRRLDTGKPPALDASREVAEKRILALYDDPVFSDKERARAAKSIGRVADEKLAKIESDTEAERDRRRAEKAESQSETLDLGGAGPGGAS